MMTMHCQLTSQVAGLTENSRARHLVDPRLRIDPSVEIVDVVCFLLRLIDRYTRILLCKDRQNSFWNLLIIIIAQHSWYRIIYLWKQWIYDQAVSQDWKVGSHISWRIRLLKARVFDQWPRPPRRMRNLRSWLRIYGKHIQMYHNNSSFQPLFIILKYYSICFIVIVLIIFLIKFI